MTQCFYNLIQLQSLHSLIIITFLHYFLYNLLKEFKIFSIHIEGITINNVLKGQIYIVWFGILDCHHTGVYLSKYCED